MLIGFFNRHLEFGKPEGLSCGAILCTRDITKRKQVEEELILQKAYFQQLFENSPRGIAILDNEDRVINANKGFKEPFQFSIEEIEGSYISEIIVPGNLLDEASSFSQAVIAGKVVQKETVRKRKDGSLVNVFILGYPIMAEGKQQGIYAIYSDITERKQAEEQLKYLSLRDPLTGLHNRTCFEQEMSRLGVGNDCPLGIILCDVLGLRRQAQSPHGIIDKVNQLTIVPIYDTTIETEQTDSCWASH